MHEIHKRANPNQLLIYKHALFLYKLNNSTTQNNDWIELNLQQTRSNLKFKHNLIFLRTMVPFAKNSLPNGLELLVDVETYDYAASSAESEGIFMSILYQLDMPIMKNTGLSLSLHFTCYTPISKSLQIN